MPQIIQNTSIERLCQTCGYDLRGIHSDRCPECGETFDPKQLAGANIPWLRRSAIGTWRAYWGTVGMVMFQPVKFGHEIWDAARLEPTAAIQFRRVVLAQTLMMQFVVAGPVSWWIVSGRFSQWLVVFPIIEIPFAICLWVYLLIATDVMYRISERTSDDAEWQRTLSHYASAPLAMAPVAGIVVLLGFAIPSPVRYVAVLISSVMLVWWWIANIAMMHVVRQSFWSSVGNAFLLLISWAFIALSAGMVWLAIVRIIASVVAPL